MYEIPENIAELDAEAVEQNINDALDAFNALGITVESSDEDLDKATAIKEALTALRERGTTLAAAEAEREAAEAAAAQEKADRVAALTEGTEVAPETPETPEVPETPAPVADAPVETPAPEPVAAGGSPVQRAANNAPPVQAPPAEPLATLVAAADVPEHSNGQVLPDMAAATTALLKRMSGLPTTNLATANGGVQQRYGAVIIRKNSDPDLKQNRDGGSDLSLIWKAGDQSRLEGGSLVAAGGWCAPSETMYDLCQFETLEGILSIPETTITRGGIRWTPGPSFDDIYTACGFFQTEAEAIAGDCKDCCTVECPDFDEIRLDAIGLCIKSPILTEHAYPELVQRFTEGALIAHQHKVNKYVLDAMVLAAGDPVVAAQAGSLSKTMESLVYTAIGVRYSYRLAVAAQLEVVAPYWLKELCKIDFAMENNRDTKNVSDAEIDAWFSARNLSIQWVYDFQDPTVTDNEVVLGDEATVLMYPAGTWVKGTADVVNMSAVYDAPNLEANQYTALFVEEGILAVQKCTHTAAVTIPICVSGKGVLDDIDICAAAPELAAPPAT